MTLKDVAAKVSEVKSLEIERDRIELKIVELKARSERMTPILSGLPGGSGEVDKIGLYIGLISEQKEKLERVNAALSVKEKECDDFFESIQDGIIKGALKLKYINGYSWTAVAHCIGNNTADSVRKACERYLMKI